jgi:hypothetical protein
VKLSRDNIASSVVCPHRTVNQNLHSREDSQCKGNELEIENIEDKNHVSL